MKKLLLALLLVPSILAQGIIIAPEVPTNTHNLSVKYIDQVMFRIANEMVRSVSARATAISVDDAGKYTSYFKYLREVIETTSAEVTDFHYYAVMPLEDFTQILAVVENPAVNASVNQLVGSDVNLRISQSNRINDGLLPKDKEDLIAAILKAEKYLVAFQQSNPLDMNHSSPYRDVVEPMKFPTGVE